MEGTQDFLIMKSRKISKKIKKFYKEVFISKEELKNKLKEIDRKYGK